MHNTKIMAILFITTLLEFTAMTVVVMLAPGAEEHKIQNVEAM